jgi:predicted DNA-binding transcriptional regulator YafY
VSSTETVGRLLDILQLIPRLPNRITVRDIKARLSPTDHNVSVRTVQRDLEALSGKFPIECEAEGRAQHWHWMKDAKQVAIPHMSTSMAATLQLARDYLKPVLPSGVLNELQPLFDHATDVLDGTPLQGWNRKVRILERGPMLIPPKVNAGVQEVVYQALLEERQIKIGYKARNKPKHKDYIVNPLGLVMKGGAFYLVVVFDGHTDLRQLALHRMNGVEVLGASVQVPRGYSLKKYVEDEEGFSYPLSPEKIKLELLFEGDAGRHLTEVKLSADQTVKERKDGKLLVKATVADSDELRWWLRGFGGDVEVRRPAGLARDIGQ